MANYSRYLLRMLPLRSWPRPAGLGQARLGWPSPGHRLVERMVADVERQCHEMESWLSRALFQATPLLAWEPAGWQPRAVDREPSPATAGEKDGSYRWAVDVAGFAPEEMSVRLDGRRVTVVARRHRESHGEDVGHWEEQQELRREILLPEDVDLEGVSCSLASEGQLCIVAPRLAMATGKTLPIDVKQDNRETSGGENQEKPKDS